MVDADRKLTCDNAEDIGTKIHKEMNGMSYNECSLKRNNQITTLLSLYTAVKIGNERVTIDPLTLFLRLIILVEKKPEKEIVDYFRYELSPYPMSLFKDGVMRSGQKSSLKQFLLKNVNPMETRQTVRIADGGALLWCCDWKKDDTFLSIFESFSKFLINLDIDIIVFDGYNLSTKDYTHLQRSGKMSQRVEIRSDNPCPTDRKTFYQNYKNKESFVKSLA